MFKQNPSLTSVGGIIVMAVGVLLSVFILTQFDWTRKAMGIPAKGTVTT
jgi:hypothetical protein